jgi:hypothetical protein
MQCVVIPLLEFFGHLLGGQTDAGNPGQPEPRRVGRRFRGRWPGMQAEERCPSHERQPTDEVSSAPALSLSIAHGTSCASVLEAMLRR